VPAEDAQMTQPSASTSESTAADFETTGGGPTLAPEPYVLGDVSGPLTRDELRLVDAWWRAANYLAVGQIYLMSNPLLREPLAPEHIKPRLLGHFGTVPGLNLVYAHVNRLIKERDLDVAYVVGPGHGGPGPNACAWLEGTYSEVYSAVTQDAAGRLLAAARVRRGARSPRSAGDLRDRRRRGRDRPAGHELALQQVRQPGSRRRGAAGAASQPVQDR
jgi:hypothetical protein